MNFSYILFIYLFSIQLFNYLFIYLFIIYYLLLISIKNIKRIYSEIETNFIIFII